MEALDPYQLFRLSIVLLFTGLILYDLIGMVVWYRGLPRFIKKVVLLKLLQIRSRTLKGELLLIVILLSIEGKLMILLLKQGH